MTNINQIDFTDAILQATDICRSSHSVKYDYIIVDEFQDISVDRYNFLKVLREGNPPAKLYCVGDDWQSIYRFQGATWHFSINFHITLVRRKSTRLKLHIGLESLWSACPRNSSNATKPKLKRTSILLIHKLKQNYNSVIMKGVNIAMSSDNWLRQFHWTNQYFC